MKIINLKDNIPLDALGACVAIGSFDGIHKGHQQIIEQVLAAAKASGKKSAILTFEPYPASFFQPEKNKNRRLTSLAMKAEILGELGVDFIFVADFNKGLAETSSEDFVKNILVEKLKASEIFTGEDFKFGHNREGNCKTIEELGVDLGFKYTKIKNIIDKNGERFSSTKTRNLIESGEIAAAKNILGRNFAISGTVIEGAKKGRELGFKTANIELGDFVKPKFGVYKCSVTIDDKNYRAVANIGVKPTFGNNEKSLLEVHILNFDQDIYGKEIKVELEDFIREEMKFNSLDELKTQIKKDVKAASLSANKLLERGVTIAILCMLADQINKFYMLEILNIKTSSVYEITSFFNIVMVWNRGISFGMFQNSEYSNYIFMFTTSIICLVLLNFIRKSGSMIEATAFGMIIGGALGNLIDRVRLGAVADFFDFHLMGNHWPAFNIADSCVFLGAAILIIGSVNFKKYSVHSTKYSEK